MIVALVAREERWQWESADIARGNGARWAGAGL